MPKTSREPLHEGDDFPAATAVKQKRDQSFGARVSRLFAPVISLFKKLFDHNAKELRKLRPLLDQVNAVDLSGRSDEELRQMSEELKNRFRTRVAEILKADAEESEDDSDGGGDHARRTEHEKRRRTAEDAVLDELLPEAFALAREVASRTLQLRPYDVQVLGGIVLHQGNIAEMKTGEGKTLSATMPVYLNALSERGVHVITVNDYLAERDANWMRPVYEFLGLTVGFVTNHMNNDARRAAYNCDVLYATNSEVGFDYLRDNMVISPEGLVQRELNFAIVDEVDNILIDEARTPLIISAQVELSDRAVRKRTIAKACDGVVRRLIPAISDPEVEILNDSYTDKGRLNLDGLMDHLLDRGTLQSALNYLVECYVGDPSSARTENIGRLADLARELMAENIIRPDALGALMDVLASTPSPGTMRDTVRQEVRSSLQSYAAAMEFAARELRGAPEADPDLIDHLTRGLRAFGYLDLDAQERIAVATESGDWGDRLLSLIVTEIVQAMTDRGVMAMSAAGAVLETIMDVLDGGDVLSFLVEHAESGGGAVTQCLESVADLDDWRANNADDGSIEWTLENAERTAGVVATISGRALLAPESAARLWEIVRLREPRERLQEILVQAAAAGPGEAISGIDQEIGEINRERKALLKSVAEQLDTSFGQASPLIAKSQQGMVQRLRQGDSSERLRSALRDELLKAPANAEVMRILRRFSTEQERVYEQEARELAKHLEEVIELPPALKKEFPKLLQEGGVADELRARISDRIRDLPGEITEVPGLVTDAVNAIVNWREEQIDPLLTELQAAALFSEESLNTVAANVTAGLPQTRFEEQAAVEVLRLDINAAVVEALETASADRFSGETALRDQLAGRLATFKFLSPEAVDRLADLVLTAPVGTKLDDDVHAEVAHDLCNRHFEPTLAAEFSEPLAEELTRRMPFSKDVVREFNESRIVGRNKEQIINHTISRIQESLPVMQPDEFKHAVKMLGWYAERDEKSRTASLMETGTLLAEQIVTRPGFPEPENMGEALLEAGVIGEDDFAAVMHRMGSVEGTRNFTDVLREVRALDPVKARRLAEAKLQEISSSMDQALKAHVLFQRDVHYVVQGGHEIVIVDEFTGRLMPGRRFSEGLHEALEAKHGVEVRLESQTVATITVQNYFRLYHKLGGMTGTARTEEAEFIKTYGLNVLEIPTNRPVARDDHPDVVFKTEEAKFRAIVGEILQCYWTGQPLLVGTRSVEISERLSERLKPNHLQMLVLTLLIKWRLWDDKKIKESDKEQVISALNAPLPSLNAGAIRNVAKNYGIDPDITTPQNVDKLMSLMDHAGEDRELLVATLKKGIPHNVLNAKNHANEARIVAEAARIGAVTIATNMAGRGVDIVLGGTLDNEAKLRAIITQILARRSRGDTTVVRSRTDDTTQQLLDRLRPDMLQESCWVTAVESGVRRLTASGRMDSYKSKDLRDALATPLDRGTLKQRVRSQAQKAGAADELPLDDDVLKTDRLRMVAETLDIPTSRLDQLAGLLHTGISSFVFRHNPQERLFITVLLELIVSEGQQVHTLVQELSRIDSLDDLLMRTVAEMMPAEIDPEAVWTRLREHGDCIATLNAGWVASRLAELHISSPAGARQWMDEKAATAEVEFNDMQIVAALGDRLAEAVPDPVRWVQRALFGLGLPRAQQHYMLSQNGDGSRCVTHYRIARPDLTRLAQTDLRERPSVTVSTDAIIAAIRRHAPRADWATEEWVANALYDQQILRTKQDVTDMPVVGVSESDPTALELRDVVHLYRLRRETIDPLLEQNIMAAVIRLAGSGTDVVLDTSQVRHVVLTDNPDLAPYIDDAWVEDRLQKSGVVSRRADLRRFTVDTSRLPTVLIESGVAGQSADWMVIGGARVEDLVSTAEYEKVKALEGLHIIGTERHESRRIDNQLRGRSGRQGDPGESRFYVSLEDELMRLFGARPKFLLDRWPEDEPVEAKIVSKSIERAQKKVEMNHFESRKHVLQYDDVMNVQREVIYGERRRALLREDIVEMVSDMLREAVKVELESFAPPGSDPREWDSHRIYNGMKRLFGLCSIQDHLDIEDIEGLPRKELEACIGDALVAAYAERREALGAELMQDLEALHICEIVEDHWMEHLAEMDVLREGIGLRGYGQRDPFLEYGREAYEMFQSLMERIRLNVANSLTQIREEDLEQFASFRLRQRLRAVEMRRGELADEPHETFARETEKVGRNDPCPCGSGKKYKNCCMDKQSVA